MENPISDHNQIPLAKLDQMAQEGMYGSIPVILTVHEGKIVNMRSNMDVRAHYTTVDEVIQDAMIQLAEAQSKGYTGDIPMTFHMKQGEIYGITKRSNLVE